MDGWKDGRMDGWKDGTPNEPDKPQGVTPCVNAPNSVLPRKHGDDDEERDKPIEQVSLSNHSLKCCHLLAAAFTTRPLVSNFVFCRSCCAQSCEIRKCRRRAQSPSRTMPVSTPCQGHQSHDGLIFHRSLRPCC
jgi:hypothetical protein